MEDNDTIRDITTKVESASTDFEKTNTELKRKYLICSKKYASFCLTTQAKILYNSSIASWRQQ